MAAPLTAAMSGVPFKQQDATTTGNGTTLAIPPSFRNHTWIVTAAAGVTSGAVTIETTNDPTDTGTWAVVPMLNSIANPLTVTAGADLMMQHAGILNFVRARISTTIAGGAAPSVTVIYNGAKSY
jgi:hypothetical protein